MNATTKMVERLPEEGSVIVVPSAVAKAYIEAIIAEAHGKDSLSKHRVIQVSKMEDTRKLVGLGKFIHIDPSFYKYGLRFDVIDKTLGFIELNNAKYGG